MALTTPTYERLLAELKPAAERHLRRKHKLAREDREDVLQESMVYLVQAMEQGNVREPAALLTIILDTRAKNRVLANKRRLDLEVPTSLTETLQDSVADQGVFSYIITARDFFSADFDTAVRNLPDDERDVFILTDLRGVNEYEAGRLLSRPASTVRAQRERARNTIRKELQ